MKHTATHCDTQQHIVAPLQHQEILQKRPIILRSLLIVATPICDTLRKNDLQLKASYASSPPCTRGRVDVCVLLEI